MRISHGPRALVGAILSLIAETTLAIPSARSESVEEFYRGKTLQINVGFGAGGHTIPTRACCRSTSDAKSPAIRGRSS